MAGAGASGQNFELEIRPPANCQGSSYTSSGMRCSDHLWLLDPSGPVATEVLAHFCGMGSTRSQRTDMCTPSISLISVRFGLGGFCAVYYIQATRSLRRVNDIICSVQRPARPFISSTSVSRIRNTDSA